jgi:hypothetical protein
MKKDTHILHVNMGCILFLPVGADGLAVGAEVSILHESADNFNVWLRILLGDEQSASKQYSTITLASKDAALLRTVKLKKTSLFS